MRRSYHPFGQFNPNATPFRSLRQNENMNVGPAHNIQSWPPGLHNFIPIQHSSFINVNGIPFPIMISSPQFRPIGIPIIMVNRYDQRMNTSSEVGMEVSAATVNFMAPGDTTMNNQPTREIRSQDVTNIGFGFIFRDGVNMGKNSPENLGNGLESDSAAPSPSRENQEAMDLLESNWARTARLINKDILNDVDEGASGTTRGKYRSYASLLANGLENGVEDSKYKGCPFCRKNGEDEKFYKSHTLYKPGTSRVSCPVLKRQSCKLCGATGIRAHTRRYCKLFEPTDSDFD